MPISQAQFDSDLTGLVNAINTNNQNVTALITAFQAWQGAHQGGTAAADLSTEDQAVNAALAAVQTSNTNVTAELTALTPAP